MKDREKYEPLVQMREMTYLDKKPTIRQSRLSLDKVMLLDEEGLIVLGHKPDGEDLDRLVIYKFPTEGETWLMEYERKLANPSLGKRIVHSVGTNSAKIFWQLVALFFTNAATWYLSRYFEHRP